MEGSVLTIPPRLHPADPVRCSLRFFPHSKLCHQHQRKKPKAGTIVSQNLRKYHIATITSVAVSILTFRPSALAVTARTSPRCCLYVHTSTPMLISQICSCPRLSPLAKKAPPERTCKHHIIGAKWATGSAAIAGFPFRRVVTISPVIRKITRPVLCQIFV